MSANKAAIQAGFRKVDTPDEKALKALRKADNAEEVIAAFRRESRRKSSSGQFQIELARKVVEAVDRPMIKVTKATIAEVQRIEDETNKLHRKINAAMKWLDSVESGCRFHEEFLLSHNWTRADTQIIEQVCEAMENFAKKVGNGIRMDNPSSGVRN